MDKSNATKWEYQGIMIDYHNLSSQPLALLFNDKCAASSLIFRASLTKSLQRILSVQ